MAAHEASSILSSIFEHGIDLRNRRVFLQSSMDSGDGIETIIRALLYLDKNPGSIELWINTEGGDQQEMFGLYDIIQTLDNEVDTIGFGWVCSGGGLILACGKRRWVTPNCYFMSHCGTYEAEGDLDLVKQHIDLYKKFQDRWATLMAKHTKHTKDWWMKKHKSSQEFWLDANGMVDHGIVDEIWGSDE